MTDRLVSTQLLRERRAELKDRIKAQSAYRSDGDPFFRICDWLLTEWEDAEREAGRQYVPTSEAARLTGWSEQTLRKRAHQVRDGLVVPDEWADLRARSSGSEWSFCVATVPVKSTAAA